MWRDILCGLDAVGEDTCIDHLTEHDRRLRTRVHAGCELDVQLVGLDENAAHRERLACVSLAMGCVFVKPYELDIQFAPSVNPSSSGSRWIADLRVRYDRVPGEWSFEDWTFKLSSDTTPGMGVMSCPNGEAGGGSSLIESLAGMVIGRSAFSKSLAHPRPPLPFFNRHQACLRV